MERNLFARKPDRVKLLVKYQWRIRGGTRVGGGEGWWGPDRPLCLDQKKRKETGLTLSLDVDAPLPIICMSRSATAYRRLGQKN